MLYTEASMEHPSWQAELHQGNVGKAAAMARLGGDNAEVFSALEKILDIQDALRAKKYSKALGILNNFDFTALAGDFDLAEFKAAIEDLQHTPYSRALAHPLTRAEALCLQGVEHVVAEDTARAKVSFTAAIAHDPKHYRAHSNLGNLHLEAGEDQAAEACYKTALQHHPEYEVAHNNLAALYKKQKRYNAQVSALKKSQKFANKHAREEILDDVQQNNRRMYAWLPKIRWLVLGMVGVSVYLYIQQLRS